MTKTPSSVVDLTAHYPTSNCEVMYLKKMTQSLHAGNSVKKNVQPLKSFEKTL